MVPGFSPARDSFVAVEASYGNGFLHRLEHRQQYKFNGQRIFASAIINLIDPDTGLEENQGPGRLKFLTAAVRHRFSRGSILATFSKADARDIGSGQPTPEAPRTIFDLLANTQRLPLKLEARGEFEYVGRKPLGTGCAPDLNAQCVGVSVEEFRAAIVRPFLNNRLDVGVNLLIAGGYTGQTIENF